MPLHARIFDELAAHTARIKVCARQARNRLLLLKSVGSDDQILITIARAVWQNNVFLGKLLVGRYSLAREHLGVEEAGDLTLVTSAIIQCTAAS
eukprot:10994412-Karenia_brevis.AAC.1